MAGARDRFDVVIDTISSPHGLGPCLRLVALDGTLSHLGQLGPVVVETTDLLMGTQAAQLGRQRWQARDRRHAGLLR